jgi:hypothetical protein
MGAELSFAGLIALSLLRINKDLPGIEDESERALLRFFKYKTPYIFFICLLIAQFFATGGLITKIRILFAIEETLWGFAFFLITPLVIIQLRKVLGIKNEVVKRQFRLIKTFSIIITTFCIGYGIYSLGYHLPIEYWPSAIAQLQMDNPVPAFMLGKDAIHEAFYNVNMSRNLSDWGGMGFIVWQTGYFSICVWMVLVFMCGPRKLERN